MADEAITLFDLESKQGQFCWSPNVWKTRLVLNYKQIPYKTRWVNHNTLRSTLEATGVPPNTPKPGGPPTSDYTVPAILTPSDGACTMDSLAIAQRLETLYPNPSLHLETGLHEQVGQIAGKIFFPLMPRIFPIIARTVVVDDAYAAFKARREAQFGAPLDEVERTRGGDVAWKAAQPGLEEVKRFLREHQKDAGPFVLGSQVSYADFMIVNALESIRILDEDLFDKMTSYDTRIKEIHQACGRWLQRND